MISLSNLAKAFGNQLLFEDVSRQLNPGERYGIVGANGCGKSTLLAILAGAESASSGELVIPKRARLGVLEQDHSQYEEERILDVVMMGHAALWKAMAEKEIAKREAKIADHKAFVERFRAKATKARQAQSKLKAIERIDIDKLPESSRRYPRFRFEVDKTDKRAFEVR